MVMNIFFTFMRMHTELKHFIIILTASILVNQSQVCAVSLKADSLIKFHGYILDSVSDNPNKLPVGAKLVLERLPYGSEIGIISSNSETGYYEYFLSFEHEYRLDIKSQGHQSFFETVKTKQWAKNGEINKNYYLVPEWKQDQVIRLRKLIFEQGKSIILAESLSELDMLASTMNSKPDMVVQLEGHTDWRGDHKSNMTLSEDRVEAVKHYLTTRGIDPKRIKTKAYGGTQPLTRDSSLEASAINRRVEVRILKIE